jgi:hypothetical protein
MLSWMSLARNASVMLVGWLVADWVGRPCPFIVGMDERIRLICSSFGYRLQSSIMVSYGNVRIPD